jgi:hypothetical protein
MYEGRLARLHSRRHYFIIPVGNDIGMRRDYQPDEQSRDETHAYYGAHSALLAATGVKAGP